MKEVAKLNQLPPVYMGKWASATNEEVREELEKGTPYTYRFRVPQEGSLKINDLIRGEVSSPVLHCPAYSLSSPDCMFSVTGPLFSLSWVGVEFLVLHIGPAPFLLGSFL